VGGAKRAATDSLSYKQQRFVHEYVRHGNGTAAAKSAGYSAKSAQQIATENLSKPLIKQAIEVERERSRQASRCTREDLIAGLMIMALGDPGDVVEIKDKGVRIKDSDGMGEARKMISSISESTSDSDKGYSVSRKVTFHDRRAAMDRVKKSK